MSPSPALRFRRLLLAVACVAPAIAACGGDPADDLVGTWTAVDGDGQVLAAFTFGDDGSYQFQEFDAIGDVVQDLVGTFDADGEVLDLDGVEAVSGNRFVESANYFVDGAVFSVGVFLPDGDVDGVVGAWAGASTLQVFDPDDVETGSTAVDTQLDLRDDNTGTLTLTVFPNEPVTVEGALQDLGDDAFVFSFAVGNDTVNLAFELLGDDEALSGAIFELDDDAGVRAASPRGALSRAGSAAFSLAR